VWCRRSVPLEAGSRHEGRARVLLLAACYAPASTPLGVVTRFKQLLTDSSKTYSVD
jgi:hypothetical protein